MLCRRRSRLRRRRTPRKSSGRRRLAVLPKTAMTRTTMKQSPSSAPWMTGRYKFNMQRESYRISDLPGNGIGKAASLYHCTAGNWMLGICSGCRSRLLLCSCSWMCLLSLQVAVCCTTGISLKHCWPCPAGYTSNRLGEFQAAAHGLVAVGRFCCSSLCCLVASVS